MRTSHGVIFGDRALFLSSASCFLSLSRWENFISGTVLLKSGALSQVGAKLHLKIPWVHVEPLVTTRLNWNKYKGAAGLLVKPITFYRGIICRSPCMCKHAWAHAHASHTKRVIAFASGYRSLSHIYSSSVRRFKSFWSSFITKGHPVNKHRCPFMNRRLCWGPVRHADWMDRILIDTFGSSSPAAVIQGGLCRSRPGGSRRRQKEQQR